MTPKGAWFEQIRLRLGWALVALAAGVFSVRAEPVISEIMASNTKTLADQNGVFSDWIELHNPEAAAVDLTGWYLTDTANNKTKWFFPAVSIPAGGYLVVFASNQDRRDPAQPLHASFALSAGGEYLGLVRRDGSTVVSEFAPGFPAQAEDVAYGRVSVGDGTFVAGFLKRATPGAANGGLEALRIVERVAFSQPSRPFRDAFALELDGADENAGQVIRYVVGTGGGAADAEPTAGSQIYAGPIAVNVTAVVRAAVFSADGSTSGPVTSAHYVKIGASLASFSSRLPVLVLDDHGAGALVKDEIDHPAWSYGYEAAGNAGAVFAGEPDFATPLEMTVRGSSSSAFPKKGYNVKLRDESGADRELSVFGLPKAEKWALVAPWSFDMNFFNNAFAYELSNRLGRWAPHTRLVEVFFNVDGGDLDMSDHVGIYLVTDRIEVADDRVDVAKLGSGDLAEPAVTGGYILKIDEKDPEEIGWTTERGVPEGGQNSVVLVAPDEDDAKPEQIAYIQTYVQRMENALHADRANGWAQRTYTDYLDRASWVDHHLLNVFASNPDALHRSAYFSKDRGGKMQAGPVWDFDRAFGTFWDERSSVIKTWSGVNATVDFWRTGWWGVLAEDPEFRQEWIDRWQSLRTTELATANLETLAQGFADTIGAETAAREVARWPDSASPYGDYASQIGYLKGWLAQRAEWIDQQFVAAPSVAASGDSLTFTAAAGAVLIYTLDGSDPRSLGGEIAPNAKTSSTPLTVPASANVHVRSYDERRRDAFPATPWSSAAGGAESTPLWPAPRLINISTRAVAGFGADALIAGAVVADTEGKRYLARAVGPGLAVFGAAGLVPDPQLSVYGANGVELFRNNGWQTGVDASRIPGFSKSVGAFPLEEGSADSALASGITAGAHTLHMSTPTNRPGVGLIELYELDANGRTTNLSTRARVRTGDGVLIGGFVVKGPAHQRLLIRAVGPTLSVFGVTDALSDPVLTLYSGQTVVATNDRWQQGDAAQTVEVTSGRVGAFALAGGSEDAALFVTLPPGAYTAEVRGKDGGEGVALLEIYVVP